MQNLYFELKEITESVGSITIYYKSVLEKMAIEVIGNFAQRLRRLLEQEFAYDSIVALLQNSVAA